MKESVDSGTAARLHGEFDRSFAELPHPPELAQEALLGLWVGGDPFAIRVSEIRGLSRDRPVALIPDAASAYLGLIGLRGALLPVWDLAATLGYPKAKQIPWLAWSAADPVLALAFERFDGYRLQSRSALLPTAAEGPFSQFASEGVEIEGRLRPVLDLGKILKIIQAKNYFNLKGTLDE